MPLDKSLIQKTLFFTKALTESLCMPNNSDASKSETL